MMTDKLEWKDEKAGMLKTYSSKEIRKSPVSIGFECLDRQVFDPEPCYEKLGRIGIKRARCQTGWNRCEPVKNQYDFTWLDDIVEKLLSQGIQPWFNVGFGNKLYMPEAFGEAAVGAVPLYYGEEALQAWQRYVRALSRHFRKRIQYFEVWNESNISPFWQPETPSPGEYARLIHITAGEIRKEIPDAKIGACIAGSMCDYLLEFAGTGILREIDFFCIHPYCIQPEIDYPETVSALRRLFDRNGGGHAALWQGEAGYASWTPDPYWHPRYVRESERNQAVWLLRRYFTDMSCGIEMSSYFQTADMMEKAYQVGSGTQKNPARHGILNGLTYTPKKAYFAMANVCSIFRDGTAPEPLFMSVNFDDAFSRMEKHSRIQDLAVRKYTFVRNGSPFFAYYLPEDPQFQFAGCGNIRVTLIRDELSNSFRNPVLIGMLTGEVYPLRIHKTGPLLELTGLPLTDYPLVICDRDAVEIVPAPAGSPA
ncbi:MAG: Beta-xylosidase [Lentisphaerae bacterium ADurb.Bin242]|nr:MAG: Beta-xylosidase [Lentisphaerae bacterium ADurb.Bin242]